MYCPSCGNVVSEGLKYCNRCGASLAGDEAGPGWAGLTGPAWAISLAAALITLGGLSMLFVLALVLVKRGQDLPPSAGIMGLAFLALIALVDWMLIRQLARVIELRRGGAPASPKRRAEPARAPSELEERPPARLAEPRESYISVTEQTTRTLEHAPRERDTRPQPQ
ncbi:MAG TPA: hypothetical protein VN228_10570 [Pyrinomonadaceae bacterium]|nr:hypothetical protein [Pyrinomonadaceae bacterium]